MSPEVERSKCLRRSKIFHLGPAIVWNKSLALCFFICVYLSLKYRLHMITEAPTLCCFFLSAGHLEVCYQPCLLLLSASHYLHPHTHHNPLSLPQIYKPPFDTLHLWGLPETLADILHCVVSWLRPPIGTLQHPPIIKSHVCCRKYHDWVFPSTCLITGSWPVCPRNWTPFRDHSRTKLLPTSDSHLKLIKYL